MQELPYSDNADTLASVPRLTSPINNSSEDVISAHVSETGNSTCWWPDGVPDVWRSALLNFMPPCTAPLIELLNEGVRQGQLDPTGFSISQVLRVSASFDVTLPESSVYHAIRELKGIFLQKSDTDKDIKTGTNSWKNSPQARGRKPVLYMCLSIGHAEQEMLRRAIPKIRKQLMEKNRKAAIFQRIEATSANRSEAERKEKSLRKLLPNTYRKEKEHGAGTIHDWEIDRAIARWQRELRDLHSTQVDFSHALTNAPSYRRAFLHAVVLHDPETPRSRREIASNVGIAKSTVSHVVKGAGIRNIPQYETVEIDIHNDIYEQIFGRKQQVRGYPKQLILKTSTNEQTMSCYPGNAQKLVQQCRQNPEAILYVQYQTASKQTLAAPDEEDSGMTNSKGKIARTDSRNGYASIDERSSEPYWRVWHELDQNGFVKNGNLFNPVTGELREEPFTLDELVYFACQLTEATDEL